MKFGAFNSTKSEYNLERIDNFKTSITILKDFDDEIATVYGEKKSILKKQGITITDFDLIIASFAIRNKMTVITNNTKHFSEIPNLRIENWLE